MRALVTGADGFIGSHLVERLLAEGNHVRAFCLYTSSGSWGWLDGLRNDRIEVWLGDVRDARQVEDACRGMDLVYHLAALVAIPHSYVAPESYLDTNVRGTMNVLEGVRRAGVGRMVHTSTSEVYGTPATLPIRETHHLNAQSPYAASKVAADQLCLAYHRSFGVPVTILRPFNTYGPRQSTRAVLPSILTQLMTGPTVRLGRLDTRRDMTYVSDTVDGFRRAGIVAGIEGEVIQLGTGTALSVRQIFEECRRVLDVNKFTITHEQARLRPTASEVEVLQSDPTRARERLGWEAKVDIAAGIEMTADWLRARGKAA